MPTETDASLLRGLDTLATRLDSLSTNENPEDLSRTLKSAFVERELYKKYLSFVVEDEARAKVFLEVFDKARLENTHYSVE